MAIRILLDTNILIPLEDASVLDEKYAKLVSLSSGKHRLFAHPLSLTDISHDRQHERREITTSKVAKYQPLDHAPEPRLDFLRQIGGGAAPNDLVDNHLLFAVQAEAVEILVSNDREIHEKARKLGLSARVYSIEQVIELLGDLETTGPARHQTAENLPLHSIDLHDPFFNSLRSDYPEFDSWFAKSRKADRRCYAIRTDNRLEALMIFKEEEKAEGIPIAGKSLKISTLKVGEGIRGHKIGELFLKLAFQIGVKWRASFVYVTVFERHDSLIQLFEEFGFVWVETNARGERVYAKSLERPPPEDRPDPFETVRYNYPYFQAGPRIAKFLVPIQPQFHSRLFPEARNRQAILTEYSEAVPEGNTIRKAYICHSSTRQIRRGSVLFFFRSQDTHAITSIGVAEEVYRTDKAEEIASLAGKRTVYSFAEISAMAKKPALLLLFWHVAELKRQVTYAELKKAGVVRGPIQSILSLDAVRYSKLKEVARLGEHFALD